MAMGDRKQSLIALGAIVLLTLGLRAYRLDAQSLWADEGNSLALAGRGLLTIARDAAHDIHPPLYYCLLHFWVRLLGTSELALRSLSALLGTILVVIAFLLGRRLFDAKTGLVAAFLSAISPFQIYYSQETRMYILTALLSALSVFFFIGLVEAQGSKSAREQGSRGAGEQGVTSSSFVASLSYLLVTVLALYTHYFAFTILLVENLAYGLWLMANGRWRRLGLIGRWAILQLCVIALYLPWLVLAWRQLRAWPAISEPLTLISLVKQVFGAFSLGLSVEATETTPIVIGFAIVFGLGLIIERGNRREEGGTKGVFALGLTVAYFALPILTMYLISLRRPMYDPKFLLLATPAYHLILARGTIGPWERIMQLSASSFQHLASRLWLIASLLFIAIASARSLHNYYFDPRYARDDYRGIAQYIEATAEEGDAILINAPGQVEIFTYYYKGPLDIYPLPKQRPIDEERTERDLEGMVSRHQRIFAVLWATDESDPGRFIEGWLDEHAYKAMDEWYGNVRLVLYAVPQALAPGEVQHSLRVNLGDKVMLLGYSLGKDEVKPGEVLPLTLFWQALTRMEERYKVFVHILDKHDHIVGQRDAEPGGGAKITTTWREGEVIADNYGILVLPATPPGEHRIEVGMYDLATGARLPVIEDGVPIGDRVLLDLIRVLKAEEPPTIEALNIQHRKEVECDGIKLLGYDLFKLGYEHQPDAPIHPGYILHLTLYWQAVGEPLADMGLTIQLVDDGNRVWATRKGQPAEGEYPTSLWEAGEIVRDQHNIPLPPDLPSGQYQIVLQAHSLPEGEPLAPLVKLEPITVEG